jgi:hypothetical protein
MQGFVGRWSNADDAGNIRECPSGIVFPFVGSEPTNSTAVAVLAQKYPNGLNTGGGPLPQCPPFAGAVRVQFDENGGFATNMQVL